MTHKIKKISLSFATSFLLITSIGFAAPLNVQGNIKMQGAAPTNLRIGAMLTDRNNKLIAELHSSATTAGNFNLNIPDTNPTAPISSLTPEMLDWPGLVGKASLTGSSRVIRVAFRAYIDADNSKTFTTGDALLETFIARGRGGVVLIWSESKIRVQAARGLDVTLEVGWNLIVFDLTQTVQAKKVNAVDGLVCEIFGR